MSGNSVEQRGEPRRRAPLIEEQEIASRAFQVENKRFYLDVKKNARGRFMKITEFDVGGKKSRILMSIPAAQEFREKLENICHVQDKLPPHNPKSLAADGLIESVTIVRDNRRYYLDLRENERGRFLRISMISMGVRVHVTLPAKGILELKNGLVNLIQDYCSEEDLVATSDLPEAKVLFAGNKTFYFDVGSNRYGVFLRISELRSNYRTAVTIPEQHWHRFRDILTELSKELEQSKMVDEKKEGQASPGESGDDKKSVEAEDNSPPSKEEDNASTEQDEGEEQPTMAAQVGMTASSGAETAAIPVS